MTLRHAAAFFKRMKPWTGALFFHRIIYVTKRVVQRLLSWNFPIPGEAFPSGGVMKIGGFLIRKVCLTTKACENEHQPFRLSAGAQ